MVTSILSNSSEIIFFFISAMQAMCTNVILLQR